MPECQNARWRNCYSSTLPECQSDRLPECHSKNSPRPLCPQPTSDLIQTFIMGHPKRLECPLYTTTKNLFEFCVLNQRPIISKHSICDIPNGQNNLIYTSKKYSSSFVSSINVRSNPSIPYGASQANRMPLHTPQPHVHGKYILLFHTIRISLYRSLLVSVSLVITILCYRYHCYRYLLLPISLAIGITCYRYLLLSVSLVIKISCYQYRLVSVSLVHGISCYRYLLLPVSLAIDIFCYRYFLHAVSFAIGIFCMWYVLHVISFHVVSFPKNKKTSKEKTKYLKQETP